MLQSNAIYVVDDRGIPSVVGNCPTCGMGDRTLVLIDFIPSKTHYELSKLYLRCICCSTIHQKQIKEIAED